MNMELWKKSLDKWSSFIIHSRKKWPIVGPGNREDRIKFESWEVVMGKFGSQIASMSDTN